MSKLISKSNLQKIASGILVSLVLMMSSVHFANAQGFISPSDNPNAVAQATGGEGSARALVLQVVSFFLGFLGLVAVIMIIYGGFLYVTAAGGDDKVGQAKKIILYSVVGIVIILLSFAIVNTVLNAGTGVAPA